MLMTQHKHDKIYSGHAWNMRISSNGNKRGMEALSWIIYHTEILQPDRKGRCKVNFSSKQQISTAKRN